MKKLLTICCFLMILPPIAHAHETYPLPEEPAVPADHVSADLITNFDKAQFRISARIHIGSGDISEIPITDKFYLLKQSVVELLKQAGFNPVDGDDGSSLTGDEDYLGAVAGVFTAPGDENALLADLISEVLRKNQETEISTSMFGYGKSLTIPAGGYFLFGIKQIGTEVFIWNYPVEIYGKNNEIEIDQYNAESVTDSRAEETYGIYDAFSYAMLLNERGAAKASRQTIIPAGAKPDEAGREANEALKFFAGIISFDKLKVYKLAGDIPLTIPEHKTLIVSGGESATRLKKLSSAVFAAHDLQKHMRAVLLQSREANVFTYKLKTVSTTSAALEILTDDELTALIAHEVGHLYFAAELANARQTKNYRQARITELKCDVIALLTLKKMKINSNSLISGLKKLEKSRTAAKLPVSSEQSPAMEEREILVDLFDRRYAAGNFD